MSDTIDISKKYKINRLGDIMLELEPLLELMCDDHDLQRYEILGLISAWVDRHRPNNVEEDV